MKNIISDRTILAMNFTIGLALVVMLAPKFGQPSDKPAGVRTAIELLDKRGPKCPAAAAVQALA